MKSALGSSLHSPPRRASRRCCWAAVGQRELHWFHEEKRAWLSRTRDAVEEWTGWDATTGEPIRINDDWTPWAACVDETDAPFVRWFAGGRTNAAFNELDRHVLDAAGGATAFVSQPADAACERTSARTLLVESVLAARILLADVLRVRSEQRFALWR